MKGTLIYVVFFISFITHATYCVQVEIDSIPLRTFGYGKLLSTAISPDGQKIATSSTDGIVRLWDITTGKVFKTFNVFNKSSINTIAFSSDGKMILAGSTLWDVVTGNLIRSFPINAQCAALSRDGKIIITAGYETGSSEFHICTWNTDSSKLINRIYTQNDRINSLAISSDGSKFLTGKMGQCDLWDIRFSTIIRTFSDTSTICSVDFSPADTTGMIILVGTNKSTRVWDVKSGNAVKIFPDTGASRTVCYSHDGSRIISCSGREIRLRDANTGALIRTFSGHKGDVTSVHLSTDGMKIISGSIDNNVYLWSVASGEVIQTLSGHIDEVHSVAFSPDGEKVLTGAKDPGNSVRLWNAATGGLLRTFDGHTSKVPSVAFSPDGAKIITGSWDSTARLWDVSTGATLKVLSGHAGAVTSVAFSLDGKKILTGSMDSTVRLWDVNTGNSIQSFSKNASSVNVACFSHDGTMVLAGLDSSGTILLDIASGNILRTFSSSTNGIKTVNFSPDDSWIVTSPGKSINTVNVWNTQSGSLIKTAFWGQGYIVTAAISAGGSPLLVNSDNNVLLVDTESNKVVKRFIGHSGAVNAVAFSPDGLQVLSGSNDCSAKLWRVESGTAIRKKQFQSPCIESIQCRGFRDNVIFFSVGPQSMIQSNAFLRIFTLTGELTGKVNNREDSMGLLSFRFSKAPAEGTYVYTIANGQNGPILHAGAVSVIR